MSQYLKAWICQTLLKTMLVYYDWFKPVIVQTDASEYCLSVGLIQCSRPIAFSIKTITEIKTHYANIERVCLSVCFGPEKFLTFLYARHVIIENDHKSLGMTQHKPVHAAPLRLQHMLLCKSTTLPSSICWARSWS